MAYGAVIKSDKYRGGSKVARVWNAGRGLKPKWVFDSDKSFHNFTENGRH